MKQEDETSIVAEQVSKEIHKCPDHRITEDNFVLGYLPLFMEMAKNPDGDYKSRPDYQTWLRNTVNGIREVEVVDNVNQDEVLFTVPPINSKSWRYYQPGIMQMIGLTRVSGKYLSPSIHMCIFTSTYSFL